MPSRARPRRGDGTSAAWKNVHAPCKKALGPARAGAGRAGSGSVARKATVGAATVREFLRATDGAWSGTLARLALAAVMLPHGAQKTFGWFGGHGFSGTYGFLAGQPGPHVFLVISIELVAVLLVQGRGRLSLDRRPAPRVDRDVEVAAREG